MSFSEVGQKQKMEKGEERRVASYALQTPPRVAHAKPPGPKHAWNLNSPMKSCSLQKPVWSNISPKHSPCQYSSQAPQSQFPPHFTILQQMAALGRRGLQGYQLWGFA